MKNFGIETELLEFKSSTSQMNRAIESLAAMLNKSGKGEVLFGVDDKGNAIGQSIGNKTLKDISTAIAFGIKPTVIPNIQIVDCGSSSIISVKVTGNSKPYCGNGLYLIRSGSENKKIDPEQLRELVFVSSPETITSLESLNQTPSFSQLKQLFIIHGLSVNEKTFEKNNGLFNSDGKYNELSYVLSDSNDVSIKVIGFSGKDKTEMAYRNEYGYKCLLIAMQQVIDYVESLNETRVLVDGSLQRKEVSLFDLKCFREAWTNACLHNKRSTLVPPAVYVYQDRIEIISSGGLPLDFSLDDFFQGISHPLNRQLQKIMGQLGIVEQTGHGVPTIVKKYGKEAFDITNNHIIVTLRFSFELQKAATSYDGLSSSQKKVLMAIGNRPTILTNELVSVCGIKIARVNQVIKELKDLGRLERIGSKKDGYWKVTDKQ
jgi:ATP-dependent DNA helicase RecG